MTDITNNMVGWFEVPVQDMERAMKFYQDVFGYELDRHNLDELDMAWFPMNHDIYGAAGTLVHHEEYKPSQEGTLVYFMSPSGDLDNELGKVEAAGGQVLQPKRSIGEHGFVATALDTEGNRIAFHSTK